MPSDPGAVARSNSPARITRRQVLTSALGLPVLGLTGLTGCGLRIGQPVTAPTMEPPEDDELARERVAVQADTLAASALAAAAAHPTLATLLDRIAKDHQAQARALRPVQPSMSLTAPSPATGSTPTASPNPADTPSGTSATGKSAAIAAAALRAQATAERAAAQAVEPELARVSGPVARLLASIAANRAVHAVVLDETAAQQAPTKQATAKQTTTKRDGS